MTTLLATEPGIGLWTERAAEDAVNVRWASLEAPPPRDAPPPPPSPSYCFGRLDLAAVTVEPLKVCLDDDSSLEDGDEEDMFDDDAFAFGDEDFRQLMSHEALRGMVPSRSHCHGVPEPANVAAAFAAPHCSHAPLHHAEKAAAAAASVTDASTQDSTAESSTASLGTLSTLASHASSGSSASAASKKARGAKRKRVSLHSDVAVVPIPPRDAYPPQVRARLWSPAGDLYRNAARNTLEFAAEGFEWRHAADDAQMIAGAGGERVHPVHYLNLSRAGGAPAAAALVAPARPDAAPRPPTIE